MIQRFAIKKIGRVAAGAIAEKYLKLAHDVEIVAFVSSVSNVKMPFLQYEDDERVFPQDFWDLLNNITRDEVDKDLVRCPDLETSEKMRMVRA